MKFYPSLSHLFAQLIYSLIVLLVLGLNFVMYDFAFLFLHFSLHVHPLIVL